MQWCCSSTHLIHYSQQVAKGFQCLQVVEWQLQASLNPNPKPKEREGMGKLKLVSLGNYASSRLR